MKGYVEFEFDLQAAADPLRAAFVGAGAILLRAAADRQGRDDLAAMIAEIADSPAKILGQHVRLIGDGLIVSLRIGRGNPCGQQQDGTQAYADHVRHPFADSR